MEEVNQMFSQGIQQFIKYQKDKGQKKSKTQKKQQKLEKLRSDLKDPIQRKQRYQLRRQAQKLKLKKQLQGKSQQQAKKYLVQKNHLKKQIKERNLQAIKNGLPILIDLVYEQKMNQKQNKSLACQIQLIMRAIKHVQNPPGIHLCGVSGGIQKQLEKMNYKFWTLASYPQNIVQVGMKLQKKLIYLSPDALQPLNEIQDNTAFIIGGLVDRTVIKNASLQRANSLNIQARCLPVRQFMKSRICLNLDHVVMILCKYIETKDWKVAFDFGAPKRWKRQQAPNGRKKRNPKKQNENDNDSQSSLKSQQNRKESLQQQQQLEKKQKPKKQQQKDQLQYKTNQ